MRFPYTLIVVQNWQNIVLPNIKPKQVHIVGHNIKKDLINTEYEFTEVLEPMSPWKLVSQAAHKIKYPYYVVSHGEPIQNELINRAEHLYNEELRPFVYLNSKHGQIYFKKLAYLGHGENNDWGDLVREIVDPRLILDEL